MRIFSLLMSAYLMVLCAIPCGDSRECGENEQEQLYSAQEHEQHDHPMEICTPFCYCACCAASVIFQQIVNTFPPIPFFRQPPIAYKIRLYSGDSPAFWQPPRLS
ncbi:MAG: DUF6660 family protein [Saprospiraceae bacterium]|nr:DUF6660 family protein [Saprospiraceae bacterium]